MKRLSQEYTKAYDEYNVKQSEVIKEILSLTLTYEPVLQSLSSTLAHLDVITCFATTAMLNSYTQPKLFPFESSRKINLIESRHPLLEVQDDINFISNDVKWMTNTLPLLQVQTWEVNPPILDKSVPLL